MKKKQASKGQANGKQMASNKVLRSKILGE
jgi:hypothetical protein